MAHDRRPDRSRKWAQRKKENGLRECLNGGKIYNLAIFLLYVVFTFLSYVVHFIPTHIPAGARLHNNGWHIAAEEIAQCASVSESTLWTSVCVEGLPFANVLVLYVDEDDDGCLYVQWRKAKKNRIRFWQLAAFDRIKIKKKCEFYWLFPRWRLKLGAQCESVRYFSRNESWQVHQGISMWHEGHSVLVNKWEAKEIV